MAKPGRNDPCPCGNGNKYKKCCQPKDEAAEREELAEAQAQREDYAAGRRLQVAEFKAAITAKFAGGDADSGDDNVDDASNAVVDLVNAGKLDEAEAASRALLARYPEVHDGWDRLGMVHEKRGDNRAAADCYRRVLEFLRENPDDAGDELATFYAGLIAKLDPEAAT